MSVVESKNDFEKAADIIREAGGRLVGRTRLQKIAYLLEAAGLGAGFDFEYRHYGPYSERLANAVAAASQFGIICEEEHATSWGGFYSVFIAAPTISSRSEERAALISATAESDPVALELAATAVFLAREGEDDPWGETAIRKPEKANAKLEKAKALYSNLRSIPVPRELPAI